MYIRRPEYYDRFHCIAGECTDTCCAGWEIDIDEDTLETYLQAEGEFGELIRKKIRMPENGEPAHFILTRNDRCPFLNDCNLCEIYTHLGEPALSQICTDHPRFYEWYADGREAGIGICCEEACRLILEPAGYPQFLQDEEFGEQDAGEWDQKEEALPSAEEGEQQEEEPEWEEKLQDPFQKELEDLLFSQREKLFGLIKPKEETTFREKENALFLWGAQLQKEYDAFLFGSEEEPTDDASEKDWNALFWDQVFLENLIDFYLELDQNDPVWKETLCGIRKNLPELLEQRDAFEKYYRSRTQEYEQLLIYFLYRYFMKARMDDNVAGRVYFALLSTGMIQLADLFRYCTNGEITIKDQIDICKLYSKEIEYDEGNVDALSVYFEKC